MSDPIDEATPEQLRALTEERDAWKRVALHGEAALRRAMARAEKAEAEVEVERIGIEQWRAGAVVSACGAYRYRLWRRWRRDGTTGVFVMLNPSTADAAEDDPTIRKCVGFARRWGFGGIEVANLFALRATDPREMAKHADPVGPANDAVLRELLRDRARVVVAWGSAAKVRGGLIARRAAAFRAALGGDGLLCLGTCNDGNPRHPLMLSYATPLGPWPNGEPTDDEGAFL